jgi:hypothetical protein
VAQRLCTHQSEAILFTHMFKFYCNIIAHILFFICFKLFIRLTKTEITLIHVCNKQDIGLQPSA